MWRSLSWDLFCPYIPACYIYQVGNATSFISLCELIQSFQWTTFLYGSYRTIFLPHITTCYNLSSWKRHMLSRQMYLFVRNMMFFLFFQVVSKLLFEMISTPFPSFYLCIFIYYLCLRLLIFLIHKQHSKKASGVYTPLVTAVYARSLSCVKLLLKVCHFPLASTLSVPVQNFC